MIVPTSNSQAATKSAPQTQTLSRYAALALVYLENKGLFGANQPHTANSPVAYTALCKEALDDEEFLHLLEAAATAYSAFKNTVSSLFRRSKNRPDRYTEFWNFYLATEPSLQGGWAALITESGYQFVHQGQRSNQITKQLASKPSTTQATRAEALVHWLNERCAAEWARRRADAERSTATTYKEAPCALFAIQRSVADGVDLPGHVIATLYHDDNLKVLDRDSSETTYLAKAQIKRALLSVVISGGSKIWPVPDNVARKLLRATQSTKSVYATLLSAHAEEFYTLSNNACVDEVVSLSGELFSATYALLNSGEPHTPTLS